MRTVLAVLLASLALAAAAQGTPRPRPAGTIPLEEPPPPPAIVESDPALESRVTLRTDDGQTVEEQRGRGRPAVVRVTPRHGRTYVLADTRADGTFTRQGELDTGLRVPQWVLAEF